MSYFRYILRFLAGNERLGVLSYELSVQRTRIFGRGFLVLSLIWYEAGAVSQGGIQVNHCESQGLPVSPDRVRLGGLCFADDSQVEWCTKKPLRPEQPGYHRLHALPFDKSEPPIPSVLDLALLSHSLYSAQQDRALPA